MAAWNRLDLSGQRFHSLIALSPGKQLGKLTWWICRCDCGATTEVATNFLRRGHTKSCGCRKHTISARRDDLTGQRFGRLVAQRFIAHGRHSRWECRCNCGTTLSVDMGALKSGRSRSCGCLNIEVAITRKLVHGHNRKHRQTTEYATWQSMKARCHNPRARAYEYYGARGIYVCDRWRHDFREFLNDMGLRPSPNLSLDRINNDGPYSPDNCRWATRVQQRANRRDSAHSRNTDVAQTEYL